MRLLMPFLPLLAAVAAAPAAHAATPAASTVLSAPGARPVHPPAVAADARGRTAVAWTQRSGADLTLVVRRGTARGRYGAPQEVARSASDPSVATGASGGAAVLWQDAGARGGARVLRVAVARGSRPFGRAQTLLSVRADITSARVLALPAGRYLAIWWQGEPGTGRHPVRYAVSSAAGRFGAIRTLAPDTGPITSVSAAAGPDGSVLAAWGTPVGGTPATQQLAAAVLPAGATRFGAVTGIRAARADEGAATVGITAAAGPGGLALGWSEQGPLPALQRASFGPFGPSGAGDPAPAPVPETVLTVDPADSGRRWAHGPALALPAAGPALAAWALLGGPGGDSEDVTSGRVLAADRRRDGTLGPSRELSAPGAVAAQPQAAASAERAVVSWTTGAFPRFTPRFAVREPDGTWAPARRVTAAPTERAPVLASSPAGVLAAWTTHGRPRSAGRPARPPVVAVRVLAR